MNPIHASNHRPYPLPDRPWVMTQTWNRLLFAHWPVPADKLTPFIPASLELDTFGGTGWLGIVPFDMSGIRLRGLPPIPFASSFPEINLRTYVRHSGKAGVFFLSLDASHRLAVEGARLLFHLPYFKANTNVNIAGTETHYESERKDSRGEKAVFRGTYRPISKVFTAKEGSLEYWLAERYCLFTSYREKLYRGDIHHLPWPLQEARAEIRENSLLPPILAPSLGAEEPLLHYSERQQTLIWPLTKL